MKRKRTDVYLGIGSNLGDKKRNVECSISMLAAKPDFRIIKISPFYKSKPVGGPAQGMFLNGVVQLKTQSGPEDVLKTLKTIESQMGRYSHRVKWGPRIIDQPLVDLSAGLKHPVLKKTMKKLLSELKKK
ncbi:MAG: 2-amino-4-hydroxy-6-hydroxymethyldihydropteridine diphosphokinase [Candidatus Omnitrophica bacterium]|nr:2-amino-4-hydroxy-6-hydroxymethyldihydropteridine diphosphokinase [Candidatus Omnitrophota bacterium]